jgi:hypothetical protein
MGIEKKLSEKQETLTKLNNDKTCRELARQISCIQKNQ